MLPWRSDSVTFFHVSFLFFPFFVNAHFYDNKLFPDASLRFLSLKVSSEAFDHSAIHVVDKA